MAPLFNRMDWSPAPIFKGLRLRSRHATVATPMKKSPLLHRAYLGAIFVKGFDGAVETLIGLAIAVAGTQRIYAVVLRLTAPELSDDRRHVVIHAIRHGASGLAQASKTFIVVYLLVHGVLKLGIALTLLGGSQQRWIYPLACLVLTGFVLFMGYHLTEHWSNWLFGFALFDLFTLALVINEWANPQNAQRRKAA
jgi:uncharacterized membrane protein